MMRAVIVINLHGAQVISTEEVQNKLFPHQEINFSTASTASTVFYELKRDIALMLKSRRGQAGSETCARALSPKLVVKSHEYTGQTF